MNLIIHIGQHKTGSKAIQAALYANPDYLLHHRFQYDLPMKNATVLRPYEMNHFALFELLRKQVDDPNDHSHINRVENYLQEMLNRVSASAKTMILSAEDLFDMHTAHESDFQINRIEQGCRTLAKVVQKFDFSVKIVCFLRRQDELLASHYAQFIKGSSRGFLSLDEFKDSFRSRLDYDTILSSWESHFGGENIQIIPYYRQTTQSNSVSVFFESVLGLKPPPIVEPFPKDLEAYNISPSRAYLEYLRVINKHYHDGFKVVHPIDVLEDAFKRDVKRSTGLTAWYSPEEKQLFQQTFEAGNQHIAHRYVLGEKLFDHSSPTVKSEWDAYVEPNLYRWVDLDTQAKINYHSRLNASGSGFHVLSRFKKRRKVWLILDEKNHYNPGDALEHIRAKLGFPNLVLEIYTELPASKYLELLWRVETLLIVRKNQEIRIPTPISWMLQLFGINVHWI